MDFALEELMEVKEPTDLSNVQLPELRSFRDHYQDIENGLSFARRILQGRIDTLTVEIERRTTSKSPGTDSGLIERLPDALAAHTRTTGIPRPTQELEPPDWAYELVAEADAICGANDLGNLADTSTDQVTEWIAQLGGLEKLISQKRSELHDRIDRIQAQLIDRYRSGAGVDDLLSS